MVWSAPVIDQSIVASIGGKRFAFSLANELPASLSIVCSEADFFPLCAVVEVMWAWSPEDFLDSVLSRKGRSVEGEVSFAFYEEFPAELSRGVTFHHVDQDVVVDEAFIDEFAVAAGKTFCRLLDEHGLAKPSSQFLGLLDQLARRIAA